MRPSLALLTSIACALLATAHAQTPPSVVITPPAACGASTSGDLALVYDLIDDQSDPCDLLVEHSTDSGATWAACTESSDPGSEGTTALTSSPAPGTPHQYIWDSAADLAMGLFPGVLVRLTPDDGSTTPAMPMATAGTYSWPNTNERLQYLSVSNNRLYATTRQSAFGSPSVGVMLDLATPATPALAAETTSLGTTALAARADGELFVTGERFGSITVFDAQTMASPIGPTGFVDTSYERADCFEFVGNWLFYAEQEASSRPSGIHIFDIDRMTRVLSWTGANLDPDRDAAALAVRSLADYAYTGDHGCRIGLGCSNANLYQIWVYDTQIKTAPALVRSGILIGEEIRIAEMTISNDDDTLLVTGRHHNGAAYYDPPIERDGLLLFDLSMDPANPTLLTNLPYDCLWHAYDPAADIIYFCDMVTDDLIAVDVSLPGAPVEVDRLAGTNGQHITCAPNDHVYYTGSDLGVDGHIVTAVTKYVRPVTPTADTTCPLDIDNTQLCALCGDCDLNGLGPSILDALIGAQIAAGLLVPPPSQAACCDVDSSGTVNVLDALLMAQSAAGLPVTLMCI